MPHVLLVSTYELGHQPLGLAAPAAWLRRAGCQVTCLDLSRESLEGQRIVPDLVAVHLPMHTATRLALPVLERVRRFLPRPTVCCYGLYAPLNAAFLRSRGVDHVLGAEYEQALVDLAVGRPPSPSGRAPTDLPRLAHVAPDRTTLPPLSRYASVQQGPRRRVAGYTEASRGCKHLCRHCPVVPVYEGRFRVVPVDVVLDDVRWQVHAGAQHVTFGDPDFFNGIGHATQVVEGVAREFPDLTYDVTVKIEHLIRHQDVLPVLRDTGCLFVTSAVESFDADVLAALDKGHTPDDIDTALAACRRAGLTLSATFVAFTPWTTLEGYCRFLAEIDSRGLIDHVAPIQLGLRLLVPEGSRLATHPVVGPTLGPFDPSTLVYPWQHPDPRVDRCAKDVVALVGRRIAASRRAVFDEVWQLAHRHASLTPKRREGPPVARTDVPYLNEPWYC